MANDPETNSTRFCTKSQPKPRLTMTLEEFQQELFKRKVDCRIMLYRGTFTVSLTHTGRTHVHRYMGANLDPLIKLSIAEYDKKNPQTQE